MRVAKNVLIFGAVGLALSLIIFGLSSVAPNFFGWLSVPFWILPAIANLGAHDVNWPLFLLSGTLCYGVVAFLIYRWRGRTSFSVTFLSMKGASDRQDSFRFWGLGTLAILLSACAAFSYLHSMGYGIAAGDLIGLRGREGDVAFAHRWATVWLITAVGYLGVSSLAGALAAPIYEDAARLPRLTARLIVALVVSFVLAVLIGYISFSMITSSHHSMVR